MNSNRTTGSSRYFSLSFDRIKKYCIAHFDYRWLRFSIASAAFSSPTGAIVMVPNPGYQEFLETMGNQIGPNFNDVREMNLLYNCNGNA